MIHLKLIVAFVLINISSPALLHSMNHHPAPQASKKLRLPPHANTLVLQDDDTDTLGRVIRNRRDPQLTKQREWANDMRILDETHERVNAHVKTQSPYGHTEAYRDSQKTIIMYHLSMSNPPLKAPAPTQEEEPRA